MAQAASKPMTKTQLVAGAAAGTMPDIVGLDGAWVNDFVKQGALASLNCAVRTGSPQTARIAGK